VGVSTVEAVQPHRPHEPQSFLLYEIAGLAVWVHLVAVVATFGLYLLFLPLLLLFWGIGTLWEQTVGRAIDSVMNRVLDMALKIVALPAIGVYLAGQWAYRRYQGRPGKLG
jgi:hypothetical protein